MQEIARSLSENSKALKNTTKALMHNATQDKPATQKVLKQ
jgi:hypothetical protein